MVSSSGFFYYKRRNMQLSKWRMKVGLLWKSRVLIWSAENTVHCPRVCLHTAGAIGMWPVCLSVAMWVPVCVFHSAVSQFVAAVTKYVHLEMSTLCYIPIDSLSSPSRSSIACINRPLCEWYHVALKLYWCSRYIRSSTPLRRQLICSMSYFDFSDFLPIWCTIRERELADDGFEDSLVICSVT